MDDSAKTGTGTAPPSAAQPGGEADEFAAIPRPRTRHPLLALGAGLLALFLVVKMRGDLTYFFSSSEAADLGAARNLVSAERGRAVLAEGTNRLVRVHGTPDRESALQVDTKGSWTFTQFFKILGTDSRLFVHRREDPLPAFRAERDVFEGRLIRFADLSFEDAIRAHFAGHVSTTHFFSADAIRRIVAGGAPAPAPLRDLTGDSVTIGPNDILAIVVRHPQQIEVTLPKARFADAEAARAALVGRGARVTAVGETSGGGTSGGGTNEPSMRRSTPDRHAFIVTVAPEERDRVLNGIGEIDPLVKIYDVRETIKSRLSDLTTAGDALAIRGGIGGDVGNVGNVGNDVGNVGNVGLRAGAGTAPPAAPRILGNIESIRTLGTVQIPPDAYLILEAEKPRDHLGDVAIALVLLGFTVINFVGLAKGLRR